MPTVSCKGLCGRDFNREAALRSGELLSTDVCKRCYTRYASDPNECFGKGVADKTEKACKRCSDFLICLHWLTGKPNGGSMPKKAKEVEELEEEEIGEELEEDLEELEEGEEPAEEEEEEPEEAEEEEEEEEEEPEEEAPKPKKTGKATKPAKKASPGPAKGAKTAPKAAAATGKKPEKAPAKAKSEPKATPFRAGSAKEKAFLMLKKGATKEELEAGLKGMCGDPWAFVQAKLLRRTTGGDRSVSWKTKGPSPSGKYKLEVGA